MAYKFLSIDGTIPDTATIEDLAALEEKAKAFLAELGLAGSVRISESEDVKAPDRAPPAPPAV